MQNIVKFTVQFDSEVWPSLTNDERREWVDRVADAINDEAYIANVKFEEE